MPYGSRHLPSRRDQSPPVIVPQSYFLRKNGWIHRAGKKFIDRVYINIIYIHNEDTDIIYIHIFYTHTYCIDTYDEWLHHQTGDPNTGLNGSSGLVRMGLRLWTIKSTQFIIPNTQYIYILGSIAPELVNHQPTIVYQ